MADIKIQGPDGSSFAFPVGTPADVIEGAMRSHYANYKGGAQPKEPDARDSVMGKVDTFVRGAADTLSFGLADEFAAGMDALTNPVLGRGENGGSVSERYAKNLEAQRATDKADAENRFGYRLAGQVSGGVTGGVGLAKNGLSLAANTAKAGGSLGKVAFMSAADGGILGAAQGFGSGEGGGYERGKSAAMSGLLGFGLGGAAPLATTAISTLARPLTAPILARLRPAEFANDAVATALRRSGQSADDVVNALRAAEQDGQGVYTVADAMGNAGQRMLSTVARNPSDARQPLVDALMQRQAGQGRRVSGALSEAFDAGQTAAQTEAALTQARRSAATVNYGAAREAAGAVDVSQAITQLDDIVRPGVTKMIGAGAADNSVYGKLSTMRSLLGRGNSQVSDFDRALMAKIEMDAVIESGGPAAALLRPARNSLDDALSAASAPYAAARDAYRQGSKSIEAVGAGRVAATRGRIEDTIPAFQAMSPAEKQAFRSGYADPLIAKVQGSATGVNKARELLNDATAAEFPAFAVPGQADRLGSRLAREQRMFETTSQALGGSRTADNLADAADAAKFDPGVFSALGRGEWINALSKAIAKMSDAKDGMSKPVIERLAKVLMERDPQLARQALSAAADNKAGSDARRAVLNAILTTMGSAGSGRLAAP